MHEALLHLLDIIKDDTIKVDCLGAIFDSKCVIFLQAKLW